MPAAALAGLVFVAVSINVERIIALHGLPFGALQTILLLLAAVVVSIVGLVPQSTTWLAVEILAAALSLGVGIAITGRRAFDTGGNRKWLASRLAAVLPGSVCYLSPAASACWLRGAAGWPGIVAGLIGGMVGAVVNAWILLVEILR